MDTASPGNTVSRGLSEVGDETRQGLRREPTDMSFLVWDVFCAPWPIGRSNHKKATISSVTHWTISPGRTPSYHSYLDPYPMVMDAT